MIFRPYRKPRKFEEYLGLTKEQLRLKRIELITTRSRTPDRDERIAFIDSELVLGAPE